MTERAESNAPFAEFVAQRLDAEERDGLAGESVVICFAAEGNQVLFVSEAFERHTGYPAQEAIGRNLSFLQGPETEPEAVEKFRHLISTGSAGTVLITNYRKDGSRFLHECEFRPVRDGSGIITHFITIQRPV
ncbi:PAS domain-containing protein [Tabrizicola sp.]|uniref:PAS domain-containing protein n=1 Tax=Tabrizicola sp. TaxID=2005166 RepID=UPI003F3D3FCB